MKLEITQADIDGASPNRHNGYNCPVARAINRTFDRDNIVVGVTSISITNNIKVHILPVEMTTYIYKYIIGNRAIPATFEVDDDFVNFIKGYNNI